MQEQPGGRYDQALKDFDQALKFKPNDPALITYRGTVYYAKGNNDQAMQLCDQAIKLNPNFGRAYYQRGMIYENQEKYDQAVADLKKAKSLGYGIDPDFIELMKQRRRRRSSGITGPGGLGRIKPQVRQITPTMLGQIKKAGSKDPAFSLHGGQRPPYATGCHFYHSKRAGTEKSKSTEASSLITKNSKPETRF